MRHSPHPRSRATMPGLVLGLRRLAATTTSTTTTTTVWASSRSQTATMAATVMSRCPCSLHRHGRCGALRLSTAARCPAALAAAPSSSVEEAGERLRQFLQSGRTTTVLTGAGVSTDSGIPDYRSPGRPPHRPITEQQFEGRALMRRRYWARSMIGFTRVDQTLPNLTHIALARAQQEGQVQHIITQNVDGLHQQAHARDVVELHGSIHSVRCRFCSHTATRLEYQAELEARNPSLAAARPGLLETAKLRPDGDVVLPDSAYQHFAVPDCPVCGGFIKPAFVFFGGHVPAEVTRRATSVIDEADRLLVLGTTLSTMSALRLVRRAVANGAEVAIVNRGETRADELVGPELRFPLPCKAVMAALFPTA